MIYDLSRYVHAHFGARKIPARVLFGWERFTRTGFETVVVVERSSDASDTVAPPRTGSRPSLDYAAVRSLACTAWVLAKSTLEGARLSEHQRMAELVVDGLIVGVQRYAVEAKLVAATFTGGKYVRDLPAHASIEQWPGVVYRLDFTLPRGVYDRMFGGESPRPQGEIGGVANVTHVRRAKAPVVDDDGEPIPPETGCGGD